MKFMLLENNTISHPVAVATYNKRIGGLVYKLSIGNFKNKKCWEYRIYLSHRSFPKPNSIADTIELNKDYDLVPVINKEKKHQKDYLNNYMYYVEPSPPRQLHSGVLLIWCLPMGYRDVGTTIFGSYLIIGRGSDSKTRNGVIYRSPRYAIELTGDSILRWSGVDYKGSHMLQEIKFIYNEKRFEVGKIMLKASNE